jgi:conjugative element/phage-associated large polyvalent protein
MVGVPRKPAPVPPPVQQEWERGTLLPIEKGKATGEWRPAVPQVLMDLWSALSLPGDVLAGQVDPMSNEGLSRAAAFPAQIAMPGLGGAAMKGSAAALDPNVLNIFAGVNSKTADVQALREALMMQAMGEDRAKVLENTGWFQGVDGKWKYEIPDNRADLNPESQYQLDFAGGADIGQLGGILEHPELFKAYPGMEDIPTTVALQSGRQAGGFDHPTPETPKGYITAKGPSTDDILSVLLHESQHAIQGTEGFSRGGNQNLAGQMVGQVFPGTEQLMFPAAGPYDIYRALAGEAEARNVQTRMGFSNATNRDIPPWQTSDIPEQAQIPVGFTGSKVLFPHKPQLLEMLIALSDHMAPIKYAQDALYRNQVVTGWPE